MAIIRINKKTLVKTVVGLALIMSAALNALATTETAQQLRMSAALATEVEQLLAERGYWVSKVDGKLDASTRHAIVAFQKVQGMKRTGVLNSAVLEALRNSSRPAAKHGGEAHVEIDLARQVLLLVDETGTVTKVLPVSTGNNERYFSQGKWERAVTPKGAFKIQRQIKGVRKAPLGTIYYPSYFNGGIAIHGSNSIPVKAASHGCARIPRFAEKVLSDMLYVGMAVYVY